MRTISRLLRNTLSDETNKISEHGKKKSQLQRIKVFFKHYWLEVFEAGLTLGIVAIGGTILPSTWLQSHLIFCVFFLIVFVIAIRRYVLTTYVVGSSVAGYYAFLLWQHTHTGMMLSLLQMIVEPFLLFVSGSIVGEMLCTQRRQLASMNQQRARKEACLEEMKQCYQAARTLNVELEQRLVGQVVAISIVSEKMVRLWGLEGQEQYDAIVDIVMHTIDANFCALYIQHNSHMALCAVQEREDYDYGKTVDLELDSKDSLISRTIQSRQVCTIHDLLAECQTTQQPVAMMAGPLFDYQGHMIGVVIVDDIPLIMFEPSTVRLFKSLLHLIQIAVRNRIFDTRLSASLSKITLNDIVAKESTEIYNDEDSLRDEDATTILSVGGLSSYVSK